MSIVRQSAWALLGVGGQQLIRFLVVVVLARLLTPAEFGVVAAAQIIITLADTFDDFGIGIGLLRSATTDPRTERSAVTVALISSFSVALLIAIFSAPLSGFLGIPQVEAVLPWMAASFFLQAAFGPILQLLFRDGRYRAVSTVQLASTALAYAPVSISLAALGWSYWAIVAGSVVQSALQLVVLFWLRPVWPTLRLDWARLRPVLHFGLGALTANLINAIARRGDNWVAGRFLGVAALGFYSRAYSLMDLANTIPGVIMSRVMIPHFARHSSSNERAHLAARQFYLAHLAAAALTFPAAIATILLAPEIIALLLGERWLAAAPALTVLGAGIWLRLAYKVSGTVVLAYGRSWRSALQQAGYAFLVVGGSLLGMRFGIVGIAWAVLFALAWQFWAQTGLALRSVGGNWKGLGTVLLPIALPAIAGTAAGIGAYGLVQAVTDPWLRVAAILTAIGSPYLGGLCIVRRSPQLQPLWDLWRSLFAKSAARAPADGQQLDLR